MFLQGYKEYTLTFINSPHDKNHLKEKQPSISALPHLDILTAGIITE